MLPDHQLTSGQTRVDIAVFQASLAGAPNNINVFFSGCNNEQ